jgi:hypothetical protein
LSTEEENEVKSDFFVQNELFFLFFVHSHLGAQDFKDGHHSSGFTVVVAAVFLTRRRRRVFPPVRRLATVVLFRFLGADLFAVALLAVALFVFFPLFVTLLFFRPFRLGLPIIFFKASTEIWHLAVTVFAMSAKTYTQKRSGKTCSLSLIQI